MQPAPAPPGSGNTNRAVVVIVLVGAVVGFSILFFFQTRDPMILIFGVIAASMIGAMLRPYRWSPWGYPGWGYAPAPPVEIVKVRCPACRALNEEHARFCSQCGKPM